MGTRSTIALEYADGTVEQVYCHWDGYLEHNGVLLSKHYSNPFILRELIDLGDVSSLKPTIGTKHAFSQFEVPTEFFFIGIKLKFPHLECHVLFIIYTNHFKYLKK